jgi:TetR/AcrR family transcriptional regulator of autoinduction and epiphytic fitness
MTLAAEADAAPRRPGRPRSQRKHDAILEAARVEFGLAGYHNANMDAIASKADVSKRTLYNHFASKETLFRALVTELVGKIRSAVTIAYQPRTSLRSQLLQYARRSTEFTAAPGNLQLLRAVLAEHIRNPALVEPAVTTYWESEYGFVAWIEAACQDGRLAARSPVEASHIFASLMRGVIVWPMVLGRSDTPQQSAIDEAIDMFLGHYAVRRR